MKKILELFIIFSLVVSCNNIETKTGGDIPIDGPVSLHPENPHYFLFKGKPLALISSAEHYGGVINLDFDYRRYLETLADCGMNYTRIFTGSYFEIENQSFGIRYNDLAPRPDRIITPWSLTEDDRSGKQKYDLTDWNEAYFERLKDFIGLAAKHDIIVEISLFSSIYEDMHWDICPLNPANNINIKAEVTRFDANTINNGPLLEYQLIFVRKMVNELNKFDNFFFELQNEPWSDHPVPVYNIVNKEGLDPDDWTYQADFTSEESMAWQEKLASVIVEEENLLPKKHLLAQNYTCFKAPIPIVNNNISIINFHYAWPEAAALNYHFNKVLGFDESGFAGSGDLVYRRQAWQFMLSGGGLFNNLDYSFFVGHEDGLGVNNAPGGGSDTLRQQLKVLSEFLHSFRLEKLKPGNSCIISSPGLIPYVMIDKDNAYAVYLRAIGTIHTTIQLEASPGNYIVRYLNTINGSYSEPATVKSTNGSITINVQIPEGELALKILKE